MVLKENNFLVVELSFERMFLYHLVSTFLPTVSLLVVSLITMYIDESHFEATIMVSLTSMLVMYTLFQSHTDSLPQTAYIKMIDIWFLHGLVIPFFVFILEVTTELAYAHKRKQDTKKTAAETRREGKKAKKHNVPGYPRSQSEIPVLNNALQITKSDQELDDVELLNYNNTNACKTGHVELEPERDNRRKVFGWTKCCRVLIPSFSIIFTIIYGLLATFIAESNLRP